MYNLPWNKSNVSAITGNRDANKKRMEQIINYLSFFQNPQNNIQNVIHTTGTNGKGSTCTFIRKILEAAGYSVSLYTSPHLIDVNERFYLTPNGILTDW